MNDETVEEITAEIGSFEIPAGGLYVNVDFNDLLEIRTEAEAFELLGKLKDLFGQ